MKTNIFITLIFLSIISIGANAQNKNASPDWYISKDVQRVANRAYLEQQSQSHLTIQSNGYPNWLISKGAVRITNDNQKASKQGNIVSTGYPDWIISKAVNRISR